MSGGPFSGRVKPWRVHSCFGLGRKALEHGQLWQLRLGCDRPDGTAQVWDLHGRQAGFEVCAASWPATLLDTGADRCRDEPPHAPPALAHDYPRPLAILRFARAVVAAVQSLDEAITAKVLACRERRIGQDATIEVRHASGGHGTIGIARAYGRAWVDHSTCPGPIDRAAQRGLEEEGRCDR